MKSVLKRPPINVAPLGGLFRCEYFQTSYVTNDLTQACGVFSNRYGIGDYHSLEAPSEDGSHISVRLAWIGGHLIEIVQATGPGMEFYNARLPADAFAIRHHHLGYLLPNEGAWQDFESEIVKSGWNVVMAGDTEGFLKFKYVEAPELDHYMEFFLLGPGGIAMFESVPAS
jgi:hypothetical protein